MKNIPPIAVVGTGRMGSSLCRWITAQGLVLDAVASRTLKRARAQQRRFHAGHAATLANWAAPPPVILLAVPDDAIPATAQQLAALPADWRHTVVLHTSGAHTSALLQPLKERGAATGSLHPLMTFPPRTEVSPKGLVFGIEGDPRATRTARALVRAWGGRGVILQPEQKAAWHLAATLACPLAVVPFAAAIEVLRSAGLAASPLTLARQGLLQLLQQTTKNLADGPAAAWTGPFARGDERTIRSHLRVLEGHPLAAYYRASAAVALALLPSRAPEGITAALQEEALG